MPTPGCCSVGRTQASRFEQMTATIPAAALALLRRGQKMGERQSERPAHFMRSQLLQDA